MHKVHDTYFHVWFLYLGIFLGVAFFCIALLDLYRPEISTVGAGFAVLVAVFLAIRPYLTWFWNFGSARISDTIQFADRHKTITVLASFAAILIFLWGLYLMLNGFIDRYRYAQAVRAAVDAQISDTKTSPSAQKLAGEYLRFPGRKEIPILVTRAGRIFSIGGSWHGFIRYQRDFADAVFEHAEKHPELCFATSQHLDPISFAAMAYLEASVVLKDGKPAADPKFLERAKKSLDLLNSCPANRPVSVSRIQEFLETWKLNKIAGVLFPKPNLDDYKLAKVVRSIYALRIQYVLVTKLASAANDDIENALEALRTEINSLDISVASELFRSHGYQEFLDFSIHSNLRKLAKRQKEMLKEIQGKPPEKIPLEELLKILKKSQQYSELVLLEKDIVKEIRQLLSLRAALNKGGEIRWIKTPGKMDTYRYLMVLGGYKDGENNITVTLLDEQPNLKKRIADLVGSPAFKSFLLPDSWAAATPLDPQLEGNALRSFFETSLKKGWK